MSTNKVTELANQYKTEKAAADKQQEEKKIAMDACKAEMEAFVDWFSKEKANLDVGQMGTILNR
jgi:hypothetical protein